MVPRNTFWWWPLGCWCLNSLIMPAFAYLVFPPDNRQKRWCSSFHLNFRSSFVIVSPFPSYYGYLSLQLYAFIKVTGIVRDLLNIINSDYLRAAIHLSHDIKRN